MSTVIIEPAASVNVEPEVAAHVVRLAAVYAANVASDISPDDDPAEVRLQLAAVGAFAPLIDGLLNDRVVATRWSRKALEELLGYESDGLREEERARTGEHPWLQSNPEELELYRKNAAAVQHVLDLVGEVGA